MKPYQFRKSSYSATSSECVEVARNVPGSVALRDSKCPDGPLIVVNPVAWSVFSATLRHTEARSSS